MAAEPLPGRARAALAVATLAATVALVYAGLRVVQATWFPEPDPRVVIWSSRAAMFWRLLIGGYAGAMVALGAWAWAGRSPRAAARWIARLVVAAGVAIALQGALVP